MTFRFPYRRFVWTSSLDLERARERLAQELSGGPKLLRGALKGDAFRCVGASRYRNRFSPVAQGRLIRDGAGTRVEGTLRMPLPTMAFLALYFGGLGAALLTALWRGLLAGPERFWLLGLPLMVFAAAVTALGFAAGAGEIEVALKRCLRVSET